MISTAVKRSCTKCNKAGGIAMCYGCEHCFCNRHFIEHRQELAHRMDGVSQEHDLLRRDLNQESNVHPLLARIDQWECDSMTTIQVAAEAARADLRDLLAQSKDEVKTAVNKMTTELQSSRESNNYTEIELDKWTERIKELQRSLETPSTVGVVEDDERTRSIRLIKVTNQQLPHRDVCTSRSSARSASSALGLSAGESFGQFVGPVELSEDGLVAKNLHHGRAYISGIGLYSSGTHNVHFRVEQMGDYYHLFFGIVTSSQKLTTDIFYLPCTYGWWDIDYSHVSGHNSGQNSDKIIRTGDKMTLTLDCERRQILLDHHRTNKRVYISIDLQKCPLPWKILIYLHRRDDCVCILH